MTPVNYFILSMVLITIIVIYISTDNLHVLPRASFWAYDILFLLQYRSWTTSKIISVLVALVGIILSLFFSTQDEFIFDTINAIQIATFVSLLMLSLRWISHYAIQLFQIFRRILDKNHVFRKLVMLNIFLLIVISAYAWCVCYGVDIVQMWVDKGPLNTNNNFCFVSGKFDELVIDKGLEFSDNDLASTCKLYVSDGQHSSLVLHNAILHKDMKSLPYVKSLIERYPGEEAKLTCLFRVSVPANQSAEPFSMFFSKDGLVIKNSSRRVIHISEGNIDGGKWFEMSLVLYTLQQSDYGLYRAGIRIIHPLIQSSLTSTRPTYPGRFITEKYYCEFHVKQVAEFYEYLDAPVGAALAFKGFYRRVLNSGNLRVEHFVNGIPLNTASNTSLKCCLPSVRFLVEVWDRRPILIPYLDISDDTYSYLIFKALVCVCPSLYGTHRFKFYRDLYNPKRKMWTTVEFWHPRITVVYPKSSNLPWDTLYDIEYNLINKSKMEKDFSLFRNSTSQYLQSTRSHDFVIMQIIETFIINGIIISICAAFIISFVYILILLHKIRIYSYHLIGIILRVNPPEPGGTLANLAEIVDNKYVPGENLRYDVFVLYVDDDRDFVLYTLVSLFKEQRLRVFLSEEDLPPGPRIEHLKIALKNSKKCIVVVSQNLENDDFYNKFFLPGIMLPRLYKGLIPCGHLMFLVCKPCKIPDPILIDKHIVVMDCTKNSKGIFLIIFKKWLISPVIKEGFGRKLILDPDLLQLCCTD